MRYFPTITKPHWRSTFKGYVRYTRGDRMCYRLLRDHGDYSKAIKAFDDVPEVQKPLIAEICRGVSQWGRGRSRLPESDGGSD